MHLLETFATTLGTKIDGIDIKEAFYSLPFDNYITFHPFSKASKNYSRWGTVLEIILPYLKERNIQIVQIGGKDEPGFPDCYHTMGKTSLRQSAYLLKNSKLHCCADTFSGHLSAFYKVPTVCLISNNRKGNVIPYFRDENKLAAFEPDRQKFKPCYAFEDPDRQIDTIKPEEIATEILKFLGIQLNYPYKLLYFGGLTGQKTVEMVPNTPVDVRSFGANNIVVRMDYLFDEKVLVNQLNQCACGIVTNRPIQPGIIKQYLPRIERIYYVVEENNNPGFVKELRDLGCKFVLFSHLPKEKIQKLKLDYCEYGLIHHRNIPQIKDIDEIKNFPAEKLVFKSHKLTLSGGKIYPTKKHWLIGDSISSFDCPFLQLIEDPEILRDTENLEIWIKD